MQLEPHDKQWDGAAIQTIKILKSILGGVRLKLDSNDYEEKLREIRAALNRIPKYMENPEFKKAIENTQRVAAALGNMVVAISQSEAVKAFGRLAEQLSNIKLPQLSEEAKEGLENYHYLNKLESLQWPLYFWVSKDLMKELAPYTKYIRRE